MADFEQDLDDLGSRIQDIVDRAVNSRNFQSLSQTIFQVVYRTADSAGKTIQRTVENARNPAPPARQNVNKLYGRTAGKKAGGVLRFAFGAWLSLGMIGALAWMTSAGMIAAALILLAGCVWLTCSGARTVAMLNRFKVYRRTLGQKTHCTLEKLAQCVGKSIPFVRRDLRLMIRKGLFLEGHLDREETCLITSDETYQYYEESRLQLEQRQRQEAADRNRELSSSRDPQVQEILDRGNAFVAQIRKCNDDIPGERISEKISRMELIVRRIFDRAEQHPEIVPDLKKLMDYYLPMTVKLLNAYADMDAQPVQGETILASKREIEATLDTLNLAFEKLLDDLFRDTAMDVSSDISVLQTLLAQEGLTEDEISGKKYQPTHISGTGE